jgi:hypothetical protein
MEERKMERKKIKEEKEVPPASMELSGTAQAVWPRKSP